MTIVRKDSAKFSKSKLLHDFNGIDIYIEDTAKHYDKLYLNIFKRVFAKDYTLNNIYPIGPRDKVIAKSKEKSNGIKRPTLFVIDGDLFIIKGEKPLPIGVYRIPFYCIENVLLDVNAIIHYMNEEHLSLREEQIIQLFDHDNWMSVCKEPLANLFIRYAMIQHFNVGNTPNVSIPVETFLKSDDSLTIDQDKINIKIKELDDKIIAKAGKDNYTKIRNTFENNVNQSFCKLFSHVSGKDYLYPIIYKKVSKILSKNVQHLNFKQRLALKCDISRIMDCHRFILNPMIDQPDGKQ